MNEKQIFLCQEIIGRALADKKFIEKLINNFDLSLEEANQLTVFFYGMLVSESIAPNF